MKISQLLDKYYKILAENHIDSAFLDAQLLLAYILKVEREFLLINFEKTLLKNDIKKYDKIIKKRLEGYSVAVLIGKKSFYGRDFMVNNNVLIPRPETEIMVELTLREAYKMKQATIIDIGTGSGCIIISVVNELLINNYQISNFKFHAIDVSKRALKIAKKNAELYKIDNLINFYHGDLLKPIIKNLITNPLLSPLIITANLPYLTSEQIFCSPSIHKEPRLALVAGDDGLKYYKKLFKQLKTASFLQAQCYILCEIDPTQTVKIKKLASSELPNFKQTIIKDLSQKNRFLKLSK